MKKTFLLSILLLIAIFFSPNFSNATTSKVTSEEDLRSAIENASADSNIIELTTDIELTKPIEITDKNITINGNNFSISKNANNWTANGSNSSLITAGKSAKLTLSNITLKNSVKYGVQSYNGGYVILDGVTINDCGYGGVLVNAGTVEIRNLSLGHNGLENSNNGIEIAKGKELPDAENSNQPKLIMNGVLNSSQTTNVIYLATNDKLTEFSVENSDTSQDKIFINGDKVILTDKNNNIKFESNENQKIQMQGESFKEEAIITIYLMDKTTTVTVPVGTITTKEDLISKINLASLGLSNYNLVNFFTNAEYTTEFDFSTPISTDTTIYAKLTAIPNATVTQKDETPKTGINNNISSALFIIVMCALTITILKRKDIKQE